MSIVSAAFAHLTQLLTPALYISRPTYRLGPLFLFPSFLSYDLWDVGEFTHPRDKETGSRTKYGTRAELEAAMKALRENGISIYVDAVLNHKSGADEKQLFKAREVDNDNRAKWVPSHLLCGWTNR